MKSIEILIFNIQMNNYGIPVYQIDQILEHEPLQTQGTAIPGVVRADELLRLPDSGMFFFPSWLRLKPSLCGPLASAVLMIDGMSGITEIRKGRIRPLPKLIAIHLHHPWIWGAALPEDAVTKDLILLLDLSQSDQKEKR